MWALLKSLGLNRWGFWKSRRYIVWRLHTAYGIPYESGFWKAIREVIRKIGIKQFIKDSRNLNQWLKSFHDESHFKN